MRNKIIYGLLWMLIASCHTYSKVSSTNANAENENSNQNEDFYTVIQKVYKSKTGQGYHRITERNYFGLQNAAPDVFKKYDVRKGFNIVDYNKFPTASFYAQTIYTIPDDRKQQAYELFLPILDSIYKIKSDNSLLHAEIIVVGYADETPINKNSEIYKTIANFLNKEAITDYEFTNYLSYLRAKEVYDIITEIFSNRIEELKNFSQVLVDITAEGKGIEFPDATKKYNLIDDKRRIAKVYWRVY